MFPKVYVETSVISYGFEELAALIVECVVRKK
jgi:hypothetical protein